MSLQGYHSLPRQGPYEPRISYLLRKCVLLGWTWCWRRRWALLRFLWYFFLFQAAVYVAIMFVFGRGTWYPLLYNTLPKFMADKLLKSGHCDAMQYAAGLRQLHTPWAEQANPSQPGGLFAGDVTSPLQHANTSSEVPTSSAPMANILYVSRHHGTRVNFYAAASAYGLEVDFMDPTCYQTYGVPIVAAKVFADEPAVALMCTRYPVIVVSDTTPDATPFLVTDACRHTHIVLEITNRFDWEVKLFPADLPSYLELMRRRLLETRAGNFRLSAIANNPWDAFYFRKLTGVWDLEIPIIRPLGMDTVPLNEAVANEPATPVTTVMLLNAGADYGLRRMLRWFSIPFRALPHHYGGPKTLAKYKALVFLPYQLSIMKMLENLRAGVVTLIPTPEFYHRIALNWPIWGTYKDMKLVPGNWTEYNEFYCPEFRDYFYHFGSWRELRDILARDEVQTDDRVQRGQLVAAEYMRKGVRQWGGVYERLGLLPPGGGQREVELPARPKVPWS
jgi:hypothetical protein